MKHIISSLIIGFIIGAGAMHAVHKRDMDEHLNQINALRFASETSSKLVDLEYNRDQLECSIAISAQEWVGIYKTNNWMVTQPTIFGDPGLYDFTQREMKEAAQKYSQLGVESIVNNCRQQREPSIKFEVRL